MVASLDGETSSVAANGESVEVTEVKMEAVSVGPEGEEEKTPVASKLTASTTTTSARTPAAMPGSRNLGRCLGS